MERKILLYIFKFSGLVWARHIDLSLVSHYSEVPTLCIAVILKAVVFLLYMLMRKQTRSRFVVWIQHPALSVRNL